jgi:N-acetyltransferase
MLDHAFRFVDRVLFRVGENNLRSQKALEKIGARLRGAEGSRSSGGANPGNLVFFLERPRSNL